MTHREQKKEAKRGNNKNNNSQVIQNSEIKKRSSKGVIKGEKES